MDAYSLRVIGVSDPANPVEVGSYETPGGALAVAVGGNYAYVADGYYGLRVIGVSDPANPVEVGFYDTPGDARSVAVVGDFVYVADGFPSSLRVVDVSNPANPSEVGYSGVSGSAMDVTVVGDYAYVADGSDGGLRVIDVSDPVHPSETGFYNTPGNARGVAVAGSYASVADDIGGLIILNYTGIKDESSIIITNDDPDPSTAGEPISVSFEVTAGFGVPGGVVTVTVAGESASCTGTLAGGVGACETTLRVAGTNTLIANYSGDDYFVPSSDVEEHTVVLARVFLPLAIRK